MARFEAILSEREQEAAPWNRVLAENANFVAFPSIGALVPGWMLVVPRREALNLRELTSAEWESLREISMRISGALTAFAGNVFMFEHGSTNKGGPVGCGVDHAHLHIVPLEFDLLSAVLDRSDDRIEWTEVAHTSTFSSLTPDTGDYLAIWRLSDGAGLVGKFRKPQSQWIRRVIAAELGKGDAWNYKEHPGIKNLLATTDTLTTSLQRSCRSRLSN